MLIGSVGDVVSAFVGWYTVWLGKNAHDFYQLVDAVVKRKPKEEVKRALQEAKDDDMVTDDPGFTEIANVERRQTVPLHFDTKSLTDLQLELAEEKYKPLIMLRAAQKILFHLDEDPPRQYTFEEWTWLLKLLGEDETDAVGHRRVGIPLPQGHQVVTPTRQHKRQVWSWLGQESPLMSLEQNTEPKWVLTKLMNMLEMDLKGRAERHIKRDIGTIPEEVQEENSTKEQ